MGSEEDIPPGALVAEAFMSRTPFPFLVGLAVLLLFSTGCGTGRSKLARVSGKVTYKGQPVSNAVITFLPSASSPPATADIQADGTYSLRTPNVGEGAVLGSHVVVMVTRWQGLATGTEEHKPPSLVVIPPKYSDPSTSGLTAEVQEGDNTINFDLTYDLTAAGK